VLVGGREVALTNQDKVFFPASGTTKGDPVRYYVDLADAVLPHTRKRPMQMKRYPNGVEGDFFYQKRVPVPPPRVARDVPDRVPERAARRLPGDQRRTVARMARQPRLHRDAHLALPYR